MPTVSSRIFAFGYFRKLARLHQDLVDRATPPQSNWLFSGWGFYDAVSDYNRMRIPWDRWRLSTVNESFEACASYPRILVVPKDVSDGDLKNAAKARKEVRRSLPDDAPLSTDRTLAARTDFRSLLGATRRAEPSFVAPLRYDACWRFDLVSNRYSHHRVHQNVAQSKEDDKLISSIIQSSVTVLDQLSSSSVEPLELPPIGAFVRASTGAAPLTPKLAKKTRYKPVSRHCLWCLASLLLLLLSLANFFFCVDALRRRKR